MHKHRQCVCITYNLKFTLYGHAIEYYSLLEQVEVILCTVKMCVGNLPSHYVDTILHTLCFTMIIIKYLFEFAIYVYFIHYSTYTIYASTLWTVI